MTCIVSHHLSCLLFLCAFRQPTTDTEPDFHDFRFQDANDKKKNQYRKRKKQKKMNVIKKRYKSENPLHKNKKKCK